MPPKKVYKKLDPITHILERSDMYVGSKRLKNIEEYVATKDDDTFKIFKKYINSSPAILRIFVEVLSNAIDNVERSKKTKTPCTTIKVNINKETGETSVWNDGDIIPIEIHEEEKIYNHSLIFGNLMAGSNYNDEEERLVAGRNGLGSKCQIFGTKVPCFDGSIKNVEDIKIGDILIGDDGKKREVLNTIYGFGEMYEVSQSRGDSYTVNSEHILSLRMPDHKVIYWSTEKQGWQMVYLDAENKKIHTKSIRALKSPGIECPECGIILNSCLNRHYRRIHKDKEIPKIKRKSPTINPPNDCEEVRNAYIEMQKFAKTITDDNTIDISIQDYLKSHNTFKSRLTGFKSECVQWERKTVHLDPYVLGLWLGDGYQHGRGFAINAEDDYEILEYLKVWGKKNDANFTHLPRCKNCKENKYDPNFVPCKNCASFSISSIENYGKMHKAPLRNLLKKYDLLEEKFIPIEYKVNDRDTRLKVLAGLIDSDGYVSKEREGRRIIISQGMMHEKLANDILYLARSLGFSASKIIRDVTWTYNNEKRTGKCISINISGNGLEDIPTVLPRKKCTPPLRREVLNTGPIKIKKVENGKFVGLTIDGNERFVINDFTVTHNCTNVFSTKFIVKGLDPNNGKVLEQTWTNNMRNTTEPKITSTKLKTGFTKVTYFPDFKQLDLDEYSDDIINLYTKYVIDAAMLTKIKVYLNEELIPVNSLETYSELYDTPTDEKLLIKNKNSEILICPANINEFQHISFVNGVYTRLGGVHVDSWSEVIFRPLVEKFNKKDKPQVNIKDIKQFFRIFVVATIPNPEFSSQDKEKLEAPKINPEVKQTDINKILKWSVIEDINDIIKMKEMVVLKKSEKKKKGYTKIEGLDPANNAGGKLGYQCSLILCEGLSAKTYAVAGIQKGVYDKAGRDFFGCLALRGKTLNVRNSIPTTIAKNKVITDLIQTLNLRHDLDYTEDKNYKTLSYGKIILLTDADVDGLHISGLIMNFFHYLFPSLLERDEPFVISMCTPIVRVFNPKGDILFYDENKFREFTKEQQKQNKTFKSKYYKGLGTTKPEDVPDTFGKKIIEYVNDDNSTTNMNKIFHKKFADTRKEWLANYDPNPNFSLDDEGEIVEMEISSFLNNEVIKFSHNDCRRSIPSLFDGLKESQRKVLYAVKKRNLTYNKQSLKVAQLGGYVAEHTNYHHGEQNLFETIINMAQDYVGSNNIPLFYRDGMFGTRLVSGKDSASPRYIFTKMESITPLIFREEDDILLDYVIDDGDVVEPKFYIPIIPMILVNGALGIGSGWSSSIPCYNPLDIIECIKIWLNNDGEVLLKDPDDGTLLSMFPDIVPWYRGFEGTIEKLDTKYVTYGVIEKNKDKIEVTELPIGMCTDKFKETAEDWLVDKKIKSMKNYSTPRKVNFIITESDDGFSCNLTNMGLYSYLHTTNMVLFNEKEQLKKYTIDEILNEFCIMRYSFYVKRKKYIISSLEKDLRYLGNKERFIQEIIDAKLKIMNVEEEVIIKELEKRKYDKENKNDESDDSENKNGYNYLLKLPVRTLTSEQVKKIKNEILSLKTKLNNIIKTSEKQMWLNDLKEFEDEYHKWLKIINENKGEIKKIKGKK